MAENGKGAAGHDKDWTWWRPFLYQMPAIVLVLLFGQFIYVPQIQHEQQFSLKRFETEQAWMAERVSARVQQAESTRLLAMAIDHATKQAEADRMAIDQLAKAIEQRGKTDELLGKLIQTLVERIEQVKQQQGMM